MSRWIELEPLIADLDKGLWGKDYDKVLAEAIIQDAPSIDIVRCGECKHWSGCKSTMHNNHLCGRAEKQNVDYWTSADDFCSYGEREGE